MAPANKDVLWASGHDESVEVNQRALIDKVLARYSSEFSVFRELLQNSDDAQSKGVEIRFETKEFIDRRNASSDNKSEETSLSSLPDLKKTPVHQWTFKNNGFLFRDEDWNRLKKIAEGNPDEDKIGAFGVGFYSLFSVTEEPFVTSGGKWMGFYWKDKKDQLFARRGDLPDYSTDSPDPWTSFEMPLRDPEPIPTPFDLARFLASSITFMVHLSEVSVFFDNKRLVRLSKSAGFSKEIDIPGYVNRKSTSRLMTVKDVKTTPLHIQAEIMRAVYSSGSERRQPLASSKPVKSAPDKGIIFSSLSAFTKSSWFGSKAAPKEPPPAPEVRAPPIDPCTVHETSVSLSVFSADVAVILDKKLSTDLHRATLKSPPSKVKYELIYTAKDQYDASRKEDEHLQFSTGSVFQGLRADIEGTGSGRIYIGHATAQTTGIGGHMAARFIPTVERDQIDLEAKAVGTWNLELLSIGGFLARVAYESELNNIRDLWAGATGNSLNGPDQELRTWLTNMVLHAFKFFSFHQTTPIDKVGMKMQEAFFGCVPKKKFPVITTTGIRDISEARLRDRDNQTAIFLKQLPFLPEELTTGAPLFITALEQQGLLSPLRDDDILRELRARPLNEEEMIACLNWYISFWKPYYQSPTEASAAISFRQQFLDAAILTTGLPGSAEEKIVPLNDIKTILPKGVVSNIPLDGPLPPHLLPVSVSKKLSVQDIVLCLSWRELTITDWLRHLCNAKAITDVSNNIELSPSWSEQVFTVLSRAWSSVSRQDKEVIVGLLSQRTCIPTSNGMKKPQDAYFDTADIFKDLPVVKFPSVTSIRGYMEQILLAIGVRKHVDLQIIFDRMIKTNEWSITQLLKYLVAVQDNLSADEMGRLTLTPVFTKDAPDGSSEKSTRYMASDLYEPLDVFRHLGLPIISWPANVKWKSSSAEAKFLFKIGLKRHPELDDLVIKLCTSTDELIRTSALRYLLDNIDSRYKSYDPVKYSNVAHIPAMSGSKSCLGKPKEVFTNTEWALMGFLVIQPQFQQDALTKLKLRPHPPATQLLAKLKDGPPKDEGEASQWFGILASRVSDFSNSQLREISQMKIVPVRPANVKQGEVAPLQWLPPTQCFFGGNSAMKFHSKLFVFVDFGPKANSFLSACGVQREPSVDQICQTLLDDPIKFYDLAGGPDSFARELTNIALNISTLSDATLTRLKKAPVLLANRRKAKSTSEKEDWDEDEQNREYDLKRANEIIIADDQNAHQLFGDRLFAAPQEEVLENFYARLGSRRLSSLVVEHYHKSNEIHNNAKAEQVRDLVLERLPLFLHEHLHGRTKVSLSWLSSETPRRNFKVFSFGKLEVEKTLKYAGFNESRRLVASAVAMKSNTGAFELWIAGNAQVDMYEVATSLNRLLFDVPKPHDALLFMTILSTDLGSLKRRGYNVDRILRQHKARREEMEEKVKAQNTKLLSTLQSAKDNELGDEKTQPLLAQQTASPPVPRDTRPDRDGEKTRPGSSVMNSLHTFKRKIESQMHHDKHKKDAAGSSSEPPNTSSSIGEEESLLSNNDRSPPQLPPKPTLPQLPQLPQLPGSLNGGPNMFSGGPRPASRPSNTVTPLSNIASNIDMAIKACRPESGNLLRNREHMQQVKESLDDGYCDISGRVGDLKFMGQIGDTKVYLSEEVPQQELFMPTKQEPLRRLVEVLRPLARLYQLPPTTLHIFNDLQGGLIAFNRGGSIFVNLRYYESWHDDSVRNGHLVQAYISLFFTLAHEIAHNLVQPHNAEHEFYFSAICEKHVEGLGRLLAGAK